MRMITSQSDRVGEAGEAGEAVLVDLHKQDVTGHGSRVSTALLLQQIRSVVNLVFSFCHGRGN